MRPLLALLSVIFLVSGCLPAIAHPHVFVDARERVVFDRAGEISAIENSWVFDQAYSAWVLQGIDIDGAGRPTKAGLQDLADLILKNLGDYDYYTFAGEGREDFALSPKGAARLTEDASGHLVLDFALGVASPHPMRTAAKISINDPTFYVSVSVRDISDVAMVGPSDGCTLSMQRGRPMPSDLAAQLYAIPANVTEIPPALKQALRGVQDAIVVTCPTAGDAALGTDAAVTANPAPANALDAIGALDAGELSAGPITSGVPPVPAGTAPVPFPFPVRPPTSAMPSGLPPASNDVSVPAVPPPASETPPDLAVAQEPSQPVGSHEEPRSGRTAALPLGVAPAEPGFALPRTGVFGWIADQQRDFYRALVETLSRIKSDGTAFWVLGGLSFLYGVFHAAGPGHGKLVISSYVLANEHQVRRGVVLSFLSAMVQSAVAVLFVLVAAMAFRMTALAMSNAVNWIGLLSYLTIALLGLWLLVRAVFGTAHNHGPEHDHDHSNEHGHPSHDHAHQEHRPVDLGVRPERSSAAAAARDAHRVAIDHAHDDHRHHDHHHHLVLPQDTGGSWRQQAAIVFGVGLRPCSGALIVLVFALSQAMFAVGIAAVFLMGLGTAVTVGTLATVASSAKSLTGRLLLPRAPWLAGAGRIAEVLGAFVVFGFGVTMLVASI